MPALEPIQERTNRDFSILHNPRFKNEDTPLWTQTWEFPGSVVCDTRQSDTDIHNSQFCSTQQIYKKVTEWFESWRPWQQRTLLCGLTNRYHCSPNNHISIENSFGNFVVKVEIIRKSSCVKARGVPPAPHPVCGMSPRVGGEYPCPGPV